MQVPPERIDFPSRHGILQLVYANPLIFLLRPREQTLPAHSPAAQKGEDIIMPLSISVTNLIVIAIVAVILFFAVRSSIRHLHGEGGCCGGSTYKAHPKSWITWGKPKPFPRKG